eukprot:TRINITY_DN43359_c0_g1_i1.p1 TRINITY_DN43359_c0_g1~~TRINITY_DN43359_c0_g1_i1.p1  ORF type:complete len:334 (-),score=45.17 TRINITY_DN43359_c0_g1_i1:110-1111(-)
MGNIIRRVRGQEEDQRAFLDSEGNLHQPASSARDVELPSRNVGYRGSVSATGVHGEEPWWTMRRCFPDFRWHSVLGLTVASQLIIYFVSCWLITPRGIVEPNPGALWKIGSSNHVAERCAVAVGGKFVLELRRLFVPIFLHAGILHILLNLYFEFVSGQRALDKYGPLRFMTLFLLSGVGGNLLSDAFETNGVGASTACYGLIGADFAQVWLLWDEPGRQEWRMRAQQSLMQTAGMLFFWEIMNWKTIDHYGHGGGFLSGFAIAVLLTVPTPEFPLPVNFQKKSQICGGALAVGTAACVVKIFFWGSQKTEHLRGRDVPWTAVCESVWRQYSA